MAGKTLSLRNKISCVFVKTFSKRYIYKMSLAVLARKTREKQRLRTRGNFILNMTGRGNVLGMNAKTSTGNCGGKCAGHRARSCVRTEAEPDCCRWKHGGKPALQMGYGVYLNRKSNGAYHPAAGPCCSDGTMQNNASAVWKQNANLDSSVITSRKKDAALACNRDATNPVKGANSCNVRKNICGCRGTDSVGYVRINHNCCTTTKVQGGRSAADQIAYTRAVVDCIKPLQKDIHVNWNGSALAFDGCCGNQCLISGQSYTFHISTVSTDTPKLFEIEWCDNLVLFLGTATDVDTLVVRVNVPNTQCNGLSPAVLRVVGSDDNTFAFEYCPLGFKKPRVLRGC